MTVVVKLRKVPSFYMEKFFLMIYDIDYEDDGVNLYQDLRNSQTIIEEKQENLLSGLQSNVSDDHNDLNSGGDVNNDLNSGDSIIKAYSGPEEISNGENESSKQTVGTISS